MPWRITRNNSKCPASKPYSVVKSDTGALVACHETEAKAKKQLAALYANDRRQ